MYIKNPALPKQRPQRKTIMTLLSILLHIVAAGAVVIAVAGLAPCAMHWIKTA